jgi:kynurenine formamidase
MAEREVVAVGSDTETFEVQPIPACRPTGKPVHTLLLIERGIYIMEGLDLEQLATEGVREFCSSRCRSPSAARRDR